MVICRKAHHGAVLEVDDQRRVDRVEERRLGASVFAMTTGHGYRNDGANFAVLSNFEIGQRVQLAVDGTADDDGGPRYYRTKTRSPLMSIALNPPGFFCGAGQQSSTASSAMVSSS